MGGAAGLKCSVAKKPKNFLQKIKGDLVMVCHNPPLEMQRNNAITHPQSHPIYEMYDSPIPKCLK